MTLEFSMVAMQSAPITELRERWRLLEELGFDRLYVGDMSHDYAEVDKGGKSGMGATSSFWLDGWTVLADMANHTERVRIGPLVTNPMLRSPALLALEAASVDHLTGGRLDIGLGLGVPHDFKAMGFGRQSWPERGARFREYVALLDGLLRCDEGVYRFEGEYFRTQQPALNPRGVQQPRPPIIVAGQTPAVLRVAGEIADCWNAFPRRFGESVEESLENFRVGSEKINRFCEESGRDPAQVRRSFMSGTSTNPWRSPTALEQDVERFRAIGCTEFVVEWPRSDEELRVFEKTTRDVMPALKQG